ncbi:hypothetical protein HDU96_003050, partial [Phlyctochytrium bullatum]
FSPKSTPQQHQPPLPPPLIVGPNLRSSTNLELYIQRPVLIAAILAAFHSGRRICVLRGPGGTGKSFLARTYLRAAALAKAKWVPPVTGPWTLIESLVEDYSACVGEGTGTFAGGTSREVAVERALRRWDSGADAASYGALRETFWKPTRFLQLLDRGRGDEGGERDAVEKVLGTLHRVIKAYKPRFEDELELAVGEFKHIIVNCAYEDGWGRGINLTTFHQGAFPLTCITSNALLDKILTEGYLLSLICMTTTFDILGTIPHPPITEPPTLSPSPPSPLPPSYHKCSPSPSGTPSSFSKTLQTSPVAPEHPKQCFVLQRLAGARCALRQPPCPPLPTIPSTSPHPHRLFPPGREPSMVVKGLSASLDEKGMPVRTVSLPRREDPEGVTSTSTTAEIRRVSTRGRQMERGSSGKSAAALPSSLVVAEEPIAPPSRSRIRRGDDTGRRLRLPRATRTSQWQLHCRRRWRR